jgi:hypothetical protein
MSKNIHQIPLGGALSKVERNEGEPFDVAGVRFTWKVKSEDTGDAFSMYEQEFAAKVCRSTVTPMAKS